MSNKRVTIFLVFAAVIGIIGYLILSGFDDTTVAYYQTVDELKALGASADGKSYRVSGQVVAGSVVRAEDGLSMTFTIDELGNTMPVVYYGIIPDTFKEGVGVLLEGKYANGRFEATTIMTKCASKYEGEGQAQQTQTAS
ncbi:MAG: cytochrome c maturation protein CcmE [candidate division KSB1 bacterium]|nr:cytochrome c maturation protein CcmE [candidate division KSB1 bacterium]MDZ7366117.1 cytochrome c maturation protein CcmE [candidate division KSB1 bacterium]MDZ7404241.1 cytochrome c maturation protein CcmE [candidate division KSB1 bacterium]